MEQTGEGAAVAAPSSETRLTWEEANEMLARLTEFYGERVAPASAHCNALLEWVRVMGESGYAPHVPKAWGQIMFTLYKSNLAHRLVYVGESVRTEPCPKHKGHWSGCAFFDDRRCECMSGSNVTGWLPPEGGAKPDLNPALRAVVLVPTTDAATAASPASSPGSSSAGSSEQRESR